MGTIKNSKTIISKVHNLQNYVHQFLFKFRFIFKNHIQMEKMSKTVADYSELLVKTFDLPIWPADHEKNIF